MIVTVHPTNRKLSKLVDLLDQSNEVVLVRDGHPVAPGSCELIHQTNAARRDLLGRGLGACSDSQGGLKDAGGGSSGGEAWATLIRLKN